MDAKIYPKRILLAVTGLSPQVVTETLFALHQQGGLLPTEVHLLSTTEGAQRARLTLLTDRWFQRLREDYSLPHICFDKERIHILEDAQNQPMDDIRTLADNQAAADSISEWIRRLTSDEQSRLHVSIAGGRKTMGFYAGYALSLFGRQQDRLSHVLVSPPYESHPQFYYPTPHSQIIYALGQSSKPLDTKEAQVTLADIPFVRLRHGLPEMILTGKSSFSKAVNTAQENLGPAHIQIDLAGQTIWLAGKPLRPPPAELAFYSWLARRKQNAQEGLKCPSEGAPEQAYAKAYLSEYRQIKQPEAAMERTENTLAHGMEKAFFMERKSKINKLIKILLGIHADGYLPQAIGKRPNTRYEVGLLAEQIGFI
jgi:CRISPR-associated protein (TIGR02584 family)